MRVLQATLRKPYADLTPLSVLAQAQPQLLLAFGSSDALQSAAVQIGNLFGTAHRIGCSTAGEISDAGVGDDSLVVTAITFDSVRVSQVSTTLARMPDSFDAGVRLASGLAREGLKAILVFGQGVAINGSAMLLGMTSVVGTEVAINGGLAGDGGAFVQTWVLDDQGVSTNRLACVGLYGDKLRFSQGSFGGWSAFGPARKITRCDDNVLYELDGQPALTVYRRYLGDHAKGLPVSGLLFPFAMLAGDQSEIGLTRTILGIDDVQGSLTLAGEIDPDGYVKLMHAGTDSLIDGAETAARAARADHAASDGGLALLVSCVGRKLVMGGRVDEEVEAVAEVFGSAVTLAGFYSNGEIGPFGPAAQCRLHNQTMTISYIDETH